MSSFFATPASSGPPKISDREIEEERRRQLALRKGGGRAGTLLSGGGGINTPILGSAATLQGGTA